MNATGRPSHRRSMLGFGPSGTAGFSAGPLLPTGLMSASRNRTVKRR
jgi:hypothetical protein